MRVCSPACAPRVHARALVLRLRRLAPSCFFSVCSSFGWFCRSFPLPCCCLPMAPKRGERRAAERADREAAERRVRQRLDEVELRIDEAEAMHRNHDQRIAFQESRKGWSFVASPAWDNFLGHAAKTLLSPKGPSSVLFSGAQKALWPRSHTPH